MKTTYVIRDGKLVEKPKPRPPVIEPLFIIESVRMPNYGWDFRKQFIAQPPPEEDQRFAAVLARERRWIDAKMTEMLEDAIFGFTTVPSHTVTDPNALPPPKSRDDEG